MVQGRLEIPLEKSGVRGFQKNVSRGFQKKMCPEVCRKNVSRVAPYTTHVLGLVVLCNQHKVQIDNVNDYYM